MWKNWKRKFGIFIVFISLLIGLKVFLPSNVKASVANSYTHTKSSSYVDYAYNQYKAKLKYHYLDGTLAYCMQWEYGTSNNVTYTLYNSSQISSYNRYVVGKAISLINADSSLSDGQKYTFATQVANCVFDVTGSSCYNSWTSHSPNYSDYVTKAKSAVAEMQTCTGTNTSGCFNSGSFSLKLSDSNYTLKKLSGDAFISSKITLSGMLESYGGTDTSYSVTISNCPSGATCSICSTSTGTNCVSSKTLTNPTSDYSFYVKVAGGSANSSFKVNASGSNSATYPYAYVYKYSGTTQMLTLIDETSVSRKVSKSLTLYLPASYTVSATKVDENGEDLTGATFEIYRATDENGSNKVSTLAKSTGSATASYTETTDTDDWTNYFYCFIETKAPVGYILGEGDSKPFCIQPSVGTESSTCYTSDEDHTEVDSVYCDSYQYYCSSDADEQDGSICRSNVEPTTNTATTCPDGYEYDSSDGLCYETDSSGSSSSDCDEEGDDGSGCVENPTYNSTAPGCETGTLVNGICYVCDDGDTFDSDTEMCIHEADAKCKNSNGSDVNVSYCANRSNYELVNVSSTGSISFVRTNTKNSVSISKTDITGETELYGARMKICTTEPDANLDCTVATLEVSGQCSDSAISNGTCTNKNSETMIQSVEWVSGTSARTWRGFNIDTTYYLVETVAPLGYAISQYTSFSISEDGTVTSGDTVVTDTRLLVKNTLNSLTISKQDLATTEELPGATLKICLMAEDENGDYQLVLPEDSTNEEECVIASLNDGTIAEWVSGEDPYIISGLDAGTYALIESMAPDSYDSSEKIVFVVNQDGTVTDVDGNSVEDNKLVMFDKEIEQPPTGDILIGLVILLGLSGLGLGGYYYFKYYKKPSEEV